MRLTSFLLPFVLLFSIQLVSAVNNELNLIGRWLTPDVSQNVSSYCCVPTSIDIQNNGTGQYLATFNYSGLQNRGYSSPCYSLFHNSDNGTMTLHRNGSDGYYSELTIYGSKIFSFQVQNNSQLNVYINSPYAIDSCEFTMKEKYVGSSAGALMAALFIIIVIGACFHHNHRKRKAYKILQMNLAQQRANSYDPAHNCIYMAYPAVPGQYSAHDAQMKAHMNAQYERKSTTCCEWTACFCECLNDAR